MKEITNCSVGILAASETLALCLIGYFVFQKSPYSSLTHFRLP